jgi:hypothetical protein
MRGDQVAEKACFDVFQSVTHEVSIFSVKGLRAEISPRVFLGMCLGTRVCLEVRAGLGTKVCLGKRSLEHALSALALLYLRLRA